MNDKSLNYKYISEGVRTIYIMYLNTRYVLSICWKAHLKNGNLNSFILLSGCLSEKKISAKIF
jgi:hypothetical protein